MSVNEPSTNEMGGPSDLLPCVGAMDASFMSKQTLIFPVLQLGHLDGAGSATELEKVRIGLRFAIMVGFNGDAVPNGDAFYKWSNLNDSASRFVPECQRLSDCLCTDASGFIFVQLLGIVRDREHESKKYSRLCHIFQWLRPE